MNPKMKKAAPLILILVLAAILLFVRLFKAEPLNGNSGTVKRETGRSKSALNRDRGFDRRISYLEYSDHARCRMKCRQITQAEVEEIMKKGKINYRKSELQTIRCPRYAVEGFTSDRQRVRIVYAQCNEYTNVVTVIDLDTDWECDCPGDDKKYENRS